MEQMPENLESEKEIIPESNKKLSTSEKIGKYARATALAALTMVGSGMSTESKAGSRSDDIRARAEQAFDDHDSAERKAAISKKNKDLSHSAKIKGQNQVYKKGNESKVRSQEFTAFSSGSEDYMRAKNLLKDNLHEILKNKKGINIPLAMDVIQNRATLISQKIKAMEELSNSGKGNSPEAVHLKEQIRNTKEMTEKIYGPVFKEA